MNSQSYNTGLLWVTLGALTALTAGTVVRLNALRGAAAEVAKSRLDSLRSWWIVALVVILAAWFDALGVTLLMACVSGLAFREFVRLVGYRESDRPALVAAFGLIPLTYLLVYWGWSGVPGLLAVGILLVVSNIMVTASDPKGFVHAASTLSWGILLTLLSLVHVPLLLVDNGWRLTSIGSVGLFLFLVALTETNDITQALVGRRIGRHKITPIVSPNKTWEGFLGGLTVTTLIAMLLGQWLLPVNTSLVQASLIGVSIAVAGFLGDIHMSALKRDVGVKDSGNLLPGQGGILDRIDSLTFTAPVFFYLLTWLMSV